jgi:hypothetical protein
MEFIAIKIGSKEWDNLWEFVANHPINKDIENPKNALHNNLNWGYIGSFKNGNKVISEVVHGCHPVTNDVYKISYEHKDFDNESIASTAKIK